MRSPLAKIGSLPSKRAFLGRYAVNRNNDELVRQTFYDSAAYAAAGTLTLAFFNVPYGQGTGYGGGTKTFSDTNMTLGSQLPKHQDFILESIEIHFQPTTPSVTGQNPANYGAAAAAAIVNDSYYFRRTGNFNFLVGSKTYLQEAPLMRFPARTRFQLANPALSDASTAVTNGQSRVCFGDSVGQPYTLAPCEMFIESTQNFQVTLAWPEGVQAIANPARIFVILHGLLIRASQ